MKILITGVYGQLGSELQRQLIVKRSPIGPIASQYDDAEVIGVDIDSVDICDYTVITEFIKSNGFDIIFNCAGYTDVDGCETDREAAFRVNSEAPGYIAEAAKSIKAKFIHISTDYVFEGNSPTPRNEYDEPGPKTVYGMSKLYGENRVLDVDSN
ncbi:MAG: sugar nucleotide-binding protein, partial [Oscillospiraceae bacterium]|nr:sugar nucleotide-binding protein [Oscillospiraceae bacterium]